MEDGWLMSESEAAYERVYGATGGPGFNTNNCLPQQVQLNITSAPAEFCLPMKNDRQFKPHFQVQVRLQGTYHAVPDLCQPCHSTVRRLCMHMKGVCTVCRLE